MQQHKNQSEGMATMMSMALMIMMIGLTAASAGTASSSNKFSHTYQHHSTLSNADSSGGSTLWHPLFVLFNHAFCSHAISATTKSSLHGPKVAHHDEHQDGIHHKPSHGHSSSHRSLTQLPFPLPIDDDPPGPAPRPGPPSNPPPNPPSQPPPGGPGPNPGPTPGPGPAPVPTPAPPPTDPTPPSPPPGGPTPPPTTPPPTPPVTPSTAPPVPEPSVAPPPPVASPPPPPVATPAPLPPPPPPATPSPVAIPSPVTPSPAAPPLVPSPVPPPSPSPRASPPPSPSSLPSPSPLLSPEVPSPSPNNTSPRPLARAVSPEPPRAGELLPDALLRSLRNGNGSSENVTVKLTAQGVTPESFFNTYMVTTATTTATLSGTPVDKWIITAEALLQQRPTGRRLQQQQQQPQQQKVLVTLSLLASSPQLIWYRLTQAPSTSARGRQAASSNCGTEYCARLAAAGIPVETTSIQVRPAYESLLSGTNTTGAQFEEAESEADSRERVRTIAGAVAGGVGGAIFLLILFCCRNRIKACCCSGRKADDDQFKQADADDDGTIVYDIQPTPTADYSQKQADSAVMYGQPGYNNVSNNGLQQQQSRLLRYDRSAESGSFSAQTPPLPPPSPSQPNIIRYDTGEKMKYRAAAAAAAGSWGTNGNAEPPSPAPHVRGGGYAPNGSVPTSRIASRRTSIDSWDAQSTDIRSGIMSPPPNTGRNAAPMASPVTSWPRLTGNQVDTESNCSWTSADPNSSVAGSVSTTATPWASVVQQLRNQSALATPKQPRSPQRPGARKMDPLEKQALAKFFGRAPGKQQGQTMQPYTSTEA